VAALAIVLAVAGRMSGGQPTVFGHPVMSMISGSMTGTINTGDLFVDDQLTATQAQDLHPGQVITFREQPGSPTLITRRIVAVETIGGAVNYVTKGDANNAADATPPAGLRCRRPVPVLDPARCLRPGRAAPAQGHRDAPRLGRPVLPGRLPVLRRQWPQGPGLHKRLRYHPRLAAPNAAPSSARGRI
jgi:signal peptidase I